MLNQLQSSTQLPVVAGVEIPLDDQGRYNLNAIHRAYETKEGLLAPQKAPAQWTRLKSAQAFVSEVEKETMQICIVSETGRNGATFAHELIAVEYAGWISPRFRILVNQTFIDYRTGKLVQAQPTAAPKDPLLAAIYQANMAVCQLAVEMDDAKRRIANLEQKTEKATTTLASATRIIDGRTKHLGDETKRIDDTVQRHEQILSHRDHAKKFSVTHIGRQLGISAQAVNKLLEQTKFQIKLEDANGKSLGWEVSTAGKRYGRQNQALYNAMGKRRPASVSWSEEIIDVLAPLVH